MYFNVKKYNNIKIDIEAFKTAFIQFLHNNSDLYTEEQIIDILNIVNHFLDEIKYEQFLKERVSDVFSSIPHLFQHDFIKNPENLKNKSGNFNFDFYKYRKEMTYGR